MTHRRHPGETRRMPAFIWRQHALLVLGLLAGQHLHRGEATGRAEGAGRCGRRSGHQRALARQGATDALCVATGTAPRHRAATAVTSITKVLRMRSARLPGAAALNADISAQSRWTRSSTSVTTAALAHVLCK